MATLNNSLVQSWFLKRGNWGEFRMGIPVHSQEELPGKQAGWLGAETVCLWLGEPCPPAYYKTAQAASSDRPLGMWVALTAGKRKPTVHFDKVSSTHFLLCHNLCRVQCPNPEKTKISMAWFSASAEVTTFPLDVRGSTLNPACWKVISLVHSTYSRPWSAKNAYSHPLCFPHQNL